MWRSSYLRLTGENRGKLWVFGHTHTSKPPGRPEGQAGILSGRLQDHGFENVRHVFTPVGGGFQDLVDFLPLDYFDGVHGILKEAGNAFAFDAVSFLFEQGKLLAVFKDRKSVV